MGVKTFCMHPEWDQEEIYGDIAILILHRLVFISLISFGPILDQSERWKFFVSNLKFNDWVSPICLPQKRKGQT